MVLFGCVSDCRPRATRVKEHPTLVLPEEAMTSGFEITGMILTSCQMHSVQSCSIVTISMSFVLLDPEGGGSFWGPGQAPANPPNHQHQKNCLQGKNEMYGRGPNLEANSGYTNYFGV